MCEDCGPARKGKKSFNYFLNIMEFIAYASYKKLTVISQLNSNSKINGEVYHFSLMVAIIAVV